MTQNIFAEIRACSATASNVISLAEERRFRRKNRAAKITIISAVEIVGSADSAADIVRRTKVLPPAIFEQRYRNALDFFAGEPDWAQFHAEHILRRASTGAQRRYREPGPALRDGGRA